MVHRANRPVVRSVSRRAFTLIELLVVIAIIAILIGLVVVVAGKVAGAGKQKQTEQVLRSLDSMLEAYTRSKGVPPATVLDPRPQTGGPGSLKYIIPIVDGRNFTVPPPPNEHPTYINTVGLFLLQCKQVPEVDVMIKGIDPKMVREYDPDVADPAAPNFGQQPSLLTAFDGWGRPIRYVHPAFKGVIVTDITSAANPLAQLTKTVLGDAPPGRQYGITSIRRANNLFDRIAPFPPSTEKVPFDADGGMPVGSTPYFYSSGGDKDPGTTDDNVYTTRPKSPNLNRAPIP